MKFIAFALVGSLGTIAHYAVLLALVELKGVNPVIASGCGAVAGLVVNYSLNFRWTFNSQQSHAQTFPKFALIAFCGLGLNVALMEWFTQHIFYFYAQILTTLLVLVWNFFANLLWTFNIDNGGHSSIGSFMHNVQKLRSGFGLLLTILAIRVLTLGFYPLYDPSESRYAEMARKMLELGNWVTPMIDYDVPFWGKPPMTIWLTALSLGIGGINDFFARLPSFLLGIGIVCIVYHLASVQRNTDKALSTVMMLASSVLFFVMSGTVAMDQCLTFGITLTYASFWLALREHKRLWGYLFFVGLGIGLLAKGPIALVLPAIAIGLWTIIFWRWTELWKHIPWLTGSILMLCIALPWYLLAEHKTPGFLEYFIVGEHWKRFTESGWTGDLYGAGREHFRGMIWIYWLAAGFPWTLILLKKILSARMPKQFCLLFQADNDWRLYCLLWMLAPLVFFTFSANIIWTYVLPGLPGLALLLSEWLQQPTKYRAVLVLTVPVSFLVLVVAYHLPNVEFYKSQQKLIETYRRVAAQDENLIYFNHKPYSADFYLHGKAQLAAGIDLLRSSLAKPSHHFYVLRNDELSKLPAELKTRFVRVKSDGKFVLLHAGAGSPQ